MEILKFISKINRHEAITQLKDIDYLSSLTKGDWKIVFRHREQELELYKIS